MQIHDAMRGTSLVQLPFNRQQVDAQVDAQTAAEGQPSASSTATGTPTPPAAKKKSTKFSPEFYDIVLMDFIHSCMTGDSKKVVKVVTDMWKAINNEDNVFFTQVRKSDGIIGKNNSKLQKAEGYPSAFKIQRNAMGQPMTVQKKTLKFHSVLGNEDEKFKTHCNTRGGWDNEEYKHCLSITDIKIHFYEHFKDRQTFAALLKRLIDEYGQCDIPQGKQFPHVAAPQLLNFGGIASSQKSRDGRRPYLVHGTYQGEEYIAKVKNRNDSPAWMLCHGSTHGIRDRQLLPLARDVENFKCACIDEALGEKASSLREEESALQFFYTEFEQHVIEPFLTMLNPSLVQETEAVRPWIRDVIQTLACALFTGAIAETEGQPSVSLIETVMYGYDFLRQPEDTLRFIHQNMVVKRKASGSHGLTRDCIHFKIVSTQK